jgi:hypothetical protein
MHHSLIVVLPRYSLFFDFSGLGTVLIIVASLAAWGHRVLELNASDKHEISVVHFATLSAGQGAPAKKSFFTKESNIKYKYGTTCWKACWCRVNRADIS